MTLLPSASSGVRPRNLTATDHTQVARRVAVRAESGTGRRCPVTGSIGRLRRWCARVAAGYAYKSTGTAAKPLIDTGVMFQSVDYEVS